MRIAQHTPFMFYNKALNLNPFFFVYQCAFVVGISLHFLTLHLLVQLCIFNVFGVCLCIELLNLLAIGVVLYVTNLFHVFPSKVHLD
jgi:hypothetical protein